MFSSQSAIGQGLLSGGTGSTITGAQNAAQQNAKYNSMLQNAQLSASPPWSRVESSKASVSINVERASNGYIIRAEGLSTIAATLEELQQHVTAIVVSNLVLDEAK